MRTVIFNIKGNTYSFLRCKYAPVESNMYVMLLDGEAIVFDALVSEEIIQILKVKNIRTIHLFITHEHYDHTNGVCWWKENFNTTLYCHKLCSEKLSTKDMSNPRLVAFKLFELDKRNGGNRYEEFKKNFVPFSVKADKVFNEPTTFTIQKYSIHTVHVPGHTPGSAIYILDNTFCISGDTIIKGHKIINGFKGGNKKDMYEITLPILQSLPDDMIILPGHGESFMKKEFDFSIYDV